MDKDTFKEIRESIEQKASCLILSGLILELMVLVVMVVFEYDKEDAIDFFFLFSVIFLMLATIYFAWTSIVKENAFELISFVIISTVLNFHAVIEVVNDGLSTLLHWLALFTYIFVQLFYFICFWFAFFRFSWQTTSEICAVNPKVITAFKLYQHFISLVKLDLILYTVVSGIYFFAIFVDWNFFHIGGILLVIGALAIVCISAGLGVTFMKREHKIGVWAFVGFRAVGEGVKGLMIFQVAYGTEPLYQRLIFYELLVVGALGFALFGYIVGLCVWLVRFFGVGLRQVIYKRKEIRRGALI